MKKQLYIVVHTHRHGFDVYPLFQPKQPTERQMIRAVKAAGSSYEHDPDAMEPEELEWRGPYDLPGGAA